MTAISLTELLFFLKDVIASDSAEIEGEDIKQCLTPLSHMIAVQILRLASRKRSPSHLFSSPLRDKIDWYKLV